MTVSIIVVSYNSEKYIIECLNSIYAQDFKDIELIVTDDNSNDNTISLVSDWLRSNSSRFIRAKLVTSPVNTGVALNCNRGFFESKGDWVKFIAFDDYLYRTDTISTYINSEFINSHKIISSNYVERIDESINKPRIDFSNLMMKTSNDAESQFRLLLYANFVPACSVFINRELFQELGYFDEDIPMVEDAPMWIKCTKLGYALGYIDEPLIAYRKHSESIVAKYHNNVNVRYLDNQIKIFEKYRIPNTSGITASWLRLLSGSLKKYLKYYNTNNAKLASLFYKMYRLLKKPLNLYIFTLNRIK